MSVQKQQVLDRLLNEILPSPVVSIDGGARNGMGELARLKNHVVGYGFEPNHVEFQKLKSTSTAHYLPQALMAKSGPAKLYLNKRPGATSTLRPNKDLLEHFSMDNWSQMKDVIGEATVDGISLGDFLRREKLEHVDFLKLDTQGNELDILESVGGAIEKISVIKTEVEMIPLYRDQRLFGDIFTFLTGHGFQFVDLQWSQQCRRYHDSPLLPRGSYRLVWGDAVFVRKPFDFAGPRKMEQALVLAELGYVDLAIYMLKNNPSLSSDQKKNLACFYSLPRGFARPSYLRNILHSIVPRPLKEAYRAYQTARERKDVTRIP